MNNRENIKQLIKNHNDRLQILREHRAIAGITADPKYILEIRQIESTLEDLQIELEALEKDSNSAKRQETIEPVQLHLDVKEGLPFELQQKIVGFLASLPNIHSYGDRLALVNSAGLDPMLTGEIDFTQSSRNFLNSLIPILTNYGRLKDGRSALEAILEAAKNCVGMDRRAFCNELIQELSMASREASI